MLALDDSISSHWILCPKLVAYVFHSGHCTICQQLISEHCHFACERAGRLNEDFCRTKQQYTCMKLPAILASSLDTSSLGNFPFLCESFGGKYPYPKTRLCSNQFGTYRIGEASNPGPTLNYAKFAVINPTSLDNKTDEFEILAKKHEVNIIAAAETSATMSVQKSFASKIRKHGFHAVWSAPVPTQRVKLDGQESKRGKAGGVAVFSQFKCRPSWHKPDPH